MSDISKKTGTKQVVLDKTADAGAAEFISSAEAVQLLGVDKLTLARWRLRGVIRQYRVTISQRKLIVEYHREELMQLKQRRLGRIGTS